VTAPGWETLAALLVLVVALGLVVRRCRGRLTEQDLQEAMAEQAAVEEALRVSEAHYRGLFEATSDGLVVSTDAGLIVDVNPAAERLMAAGPGEMLGRPLSTYLDFDDELAHPAEGPSFPIAFTRVPFGAGQQLVTVTHIGELLELRARLALAERLEAIARLAGGVAHDFNNLLTALRANADVLRQQVRRLPDPTEAEECLEGIEEATDRGVTLTRQLLAFGRRQELRPEVIDPAAFLVRTRPLLERVLRDNLVLHVQSPEVPSGLGIRVDPVQLETSLMNLVINATDAIRDGGTVRIELFDRNDQVVVAVEDTGDGIAEEALPHIFEPFYTTKRGNGSGLGLASVHGFVTQSGGTVEARNVEGGARFELVLPRVDAPPEAAPEPPPPARDEARDTRGEERILLIDDDASVRRTVQRMLRSAGYDVHAVGSGDEGLAHLESHPVDLLITDVMMPGLSGFEVADRVSPDLPVIFISGYTEELMGDRRGRFLAKPFVPRELLAIVRESLD